MMVGLAAQEQFRADELPAGNHAVLACLSWVITLGDVEAERVNDG